MSEATAPPATPASTQDTLELKYYWPSWLPHGLRVDPCASSVEDNGFGFGASTDGMHLKIAGGSGVHWVSYLPPCSDDYESVTVRGQQGCVNVDADRNYIRLFWEERKTIYVAMSRGMQLEDLLATVESLKDIGHDVFQQQLEPLITPTVTPSGSLVYYWPSEFPKELIVDPMGSSADETGFVLQLVSPGNEWSAVIRGGSKADLDEFCSDLYEPGIVRGQQGFINMGTGAGFGVAWRENGHPYVVGGPGMSLAEVRALAEALEAVDLMEWQRSLEQSQ